MNSGVSTFGHLVNFSILGFCYGLLLPSVYSRAVLMQAFILFNHCVCSSMFKPLKYSIVSVPYKNLFDFFFFLFFRNSAEISYENIQAKHH